MAETSILTDIKSMLGFADGYIAFDLDIRLWINSAFGTLHQLGVGPENGLTIANKDATWDQFLAPGPQLDLVKTYVYARTRYNFDPPGTGFHTEAAKEVIKEHEWRIREMREETEWVPPVEPPAYVPYDPFGSDLE